MAVWRNWVFNKKKLKIITKIELEKKLNYQNGKQFFKWQLFK